MSLIFDKFSASKLIFLLLNDPVSLTRNEIVRDRQIVASKNKKVRNVVHNTCSLIAQCNLE